MLVSLTRGPLHWRRTQQTPPKHWHLYIIVRDSCPIRPVPLWAPSISRTVFIKLGISVIKSDHCSQHNVITWSCYVAWCHGEHSVNRLSIDRRPRPFNAPKKADATRLNPKAGTKSGWFCWAAATCSGTSVGVGVLLSPCFRCALALTWTYMFAAVCLTLNLPTTTTVAQPFNVIKWQLKFNPVA